MFQRRFEILILLAASCGILAALLISKGYFGTPYRRSQVPEGTQKVSLKYDREIDPYVRNVPANPDKDQIYYKGGIAYYEEGAAESHAALSTSSGAREVRVVPLEAEIKIPEPAVKESEETFDSDEILQKDFLEF